MNIITKIAVVVVTSSMSMGVLAADCDWYGSPTPLCTTQDSGWGWENNASCIGSTTCADAGGLSGGSTTNSNTSSNNTTNNSGGTPTCSSASSDPDGDGWGWENEASCQVDSSSSTSQTNDQNQNQDQNQNTSNTTSNSGSAGSCDWYGTPTPICNTESDSWGWENGASCVGENLCRDIGGLSGGSSSNNSNQDNNQNNQGSNNQSSNSGSCGTGTCPTSLTCPSGANSCGCYTVNGLGANKRAYSDAGADRDFLASAMMETEVMDTNYAYGDNKVNDAFNAGATKQNWGMMRQCHSAWTGYGASDYAISDQMNDSRSLDVQVYKECNSMFGSSWLAGHRNGSSGLDNPNTADIQLFKNGHDWTVNQLVGHECDDVRFWVDIPAI